MPAKKKGVKHRQSSPKKHAAPKQEPTKARGVLSKVPSASTIEQETSEKDISLMKLIHYNLLFFIPILVFALFALKIGAIYSEYFEASPAVTSKIFMIPFMALIFAFIIPYIRDREKIAGIRYSIVAFMLVGVGISFPSALKGDYGLLLMLPTYFATYIILTFFFCPEVLGIERNMRDWFKHKKQLSIVAIYISVVLLYVIGFGGLYSEIYHDPFNTEAFSFAGDKEVSIPTFIYYSMVSFTSTGYGEILPVSTAARLLFFMEGLIALIMNVLFIAILLVFVSNAEFLSQKKEEKELEKEFRKEEAEIKKEEAEIKKVEREVETVEKEEGFIKTFFKKIRPW
jgi:voltage-gated potassium channel